MTEMPETPADCVDDIPLTQLHRELIIVRIELLINRRVSVAVVAAIEEAHAAAMRALIAPITAAEVDKEWCRASTNCNDPPGICVVCGSAISRPNQPCRGRAAVDPALIGYRPNNDFGDLDSGLRDHDEF